MVLTGLYDQYLDLDIMIDYLVRAVLANDTDEAVKLGLLSVDPEDFAVSRRLPAPRRWTWWASSGRASNDL
jgi:Na+-transporting NADH:ubiquinone oxidoreductase subunit NqrA